MSESLLLFLMRLKSRESGGTFPSRGRAWPRVGCADFWVCTQSTLRWFEASWVFCLISSVSVFPVAWVFSSQVRASWSRVMGLHSKWGSASYYALPPVAGGVQEAGERQTPKTRTCSLSCSHNNLGYWVQTCWSIVCLGNIVETFKLSVCSLRSLFQDHSSRLRLLFVPVAGSMILQVRLFFL